MTEKLFRRTLIEHNCDSEVIRERYTDSRGIEFEIFRPGLDNDNNYYLKLIVKQPFDIEKDTCLETDDLELALHEAAVYIEGVFSNITAILNMTSESIIKQFADDFDRW